MKGIPFLSKMVYKRVKVWTSRPPRRNLLNTPQGVNISWRDQVTKEVLYGEFLRVSDKIASRMGPAGHCYRRAELPANRLVLWESKHMRRGRGRQRHSSLT